MFVYYTDNNGGYIIRLDTETGDQVVLTYQHPMLPSSFQWRFGGTTPLSDGSILVFTDQRGTNQQALKVGPDLDPAAVTQWLDPFAQVGINGFSDYQFASGAIGPDGTHWLDWSYGADQTTGPAYAITGWDANGNRIDTLAECRTMYDAGGDGGPYMGNNHTGCVHVTMFDGMIHRARDGWDGIYRYAPDGSVWESSPIPTDFYAGGGFYVQRQDYAGHYEGLGVLTVVNSNDQLVTAGADKKQWVRIFDPANVPWSDVPSNNGLLQGTNPHSWGDPIAEWNPWGAGGPDPAYQIGVDAAREGAQLIDGTTMIYGGLSPDPSLAFSLYQMDLLTGTITHFADAPLINFAVDGTIVAAGDPSVWDNNGVNPMGLVIGQSAPTSGPGEMPLRLYPRDDDRGVGAGHVWPPPRTGLPGGYF